MSREDIVGFRDGSPIRRHPDSTTPQEADVPDTIRIELDNKTRRFYQGAAAANEVLDAHAEIEWPDHDTRVKTFWFYVGALAAGDGKCVTEEDFTYFATGASTRAPQPEEDA